MWCSGVVKRISDDENPWVKAGKTRACYKAGEAAKYIGMRYPMQT